MTAYDFYDPFEESMKVHGNVGKKNRKLKEVQVDRRIEEAYGGRIERIGPYNGREAKMRCRCRECECEFLQRAASVFFGRAACMCNPFFSTWNKRYSER